jgi:fructose-1,6-bisphosphatase/inositol monophosphatase family enzyme
MMDLAILGGEIVDDVLSEHHQGILALSKSDGSPVTEIDLAINSLVVRTIEKEYPDYRIIGEEESGGREDSEIAVVVDPIDGTAPLTWGVPTSMISIALTEAGVSKAAVLYDPFMKRMYTALKGSGAFSFNYSQPFSGTMPPAKSIHTSFRSLKGSTVNMCGYNAFINHYPYAIDRSLKNEGQGARMVDTGSFCRNALLVALGHWTASIGGFDTCHDGAAVALIVPEAGGKVTDLEGNDQRYDRPMNGIVATNGTVHDEVLAIIAECKK